MNIADFNTHVIQRGVLFLPPDLNTHEARVQLAATAGQESNWSARIQTPHGYARSYFQCEGSSGSGLAGVVADPVAGGLLQKVCVQFDIPFTTADIFEAIMHHDIVAYAVARLIYMMDPDPLPPVGNTTAAWNYYLKVWRPGKPDPERWIGVYALTITNVP